MLNDSFQRAMASLREDLTNVFENFCPSVRKDLLNRVMRETGSTFDELLQAWRSGVAKSRTKRISLASISSASFTYEIS